MTAYVWAVADVRVDWEAMSKPPAASPATHDFTAYSASHGK